MPRRDPLLVWLDGEHVATLTTKGAPGQVTCRYTPAALERYPMNTPLLSCSLLTSPRPLDGARFFRGLLPEGDHVQALAARANVAAYDTFGLLARYGRDVAGALVIADTLEARQGGVVEYSPEGLAEEVANLTENPLGIHDDSELSIAGIQDKLLLVSVGAGRWARPVHGQPSTHILKVEDRRYPGMAEREVGCLHLARAVGLTTIDAETAKYADVPCIIVSRFDREYTADGTVTRRIHQEDACQALDVDIEAHQRRGKYESHGGPTFRQIARQLDLHAVDAVTELTQLAKTVAFTVAIGNADAHGKNLALLHDVPGQVRLAPLYDTVPTLLWPKLRNTAAMTVAGRSALTDPSSLGVETIVTEARTWPLAPATAGSAAVEVLEQLCAAAGSLDLLDGLGEFVAARAATMLRS